MVYIERLTYSPKLFKNLLIMIIKLLSKGLCISHALFFSTVKRSFLMTIVFISMNAFPQSTQLVYDSVNDHAQNISSQTERVFKSENFAETEFFKASETTTTKQAYDVIQKIKLEFRTPNKLIREIGLGFSDMTTMDYDYGYDLKMSNVKSNDIYTTLYGQKMVFQAYPSIKSKIEIPLAFNVSGNRMYSIKATKFNYLSSDQKVYLRDNEMNIYFNLKSGESYNFKSNVGQFNDRFVIIFLGKGKTMDNNITDLNGALVYFNTSSDKLFVKGLDSLVKNLIITNMLGQQVIGLNNVTTHNMTDGIHITNLKSGVYLVSLKTDTNQIITKKIIID